MKHDDTTVTTITTANGQQVTDTQIESYNDQQQKGNIKRAAYDTILLLSDGNKRTAREIAKKMGIEITNVTRNVNNLKRRGIIPTPTKTRCTTTGVTVSNYTLTDELLNIKKASTLRFADEAQRMLDEPIYELHKLILAQLTKQGIYAVVTQEKAVLAIDGDNLTQYITIEKKHAEISKIEAHGIKVVEVLYFDDFVGVFGLEKL